MLDLSKAVKLDGMDAIIPALKYQIVHVAWMHECPSKASVLFLFFFPRGQCSSSAGCLILGICY